MAIKHSDEITGEFDYDDQMFDINLFGELSLRKGYKGPIDLPKGCVSCTQMFFDSDLTGCYLRDFDTSAVTNMTCMFGSCVIPEGFSLGDNFNTANVRRMPNMFAYTTLPDGFSLGDRFNTSNVTDMSEMFRECQMGKDFSLGKHFDTKTVEDCYQMFMNCKMCEGFSLGDKFDVRTAHDAHEMFADCFLSGAIELEGKFRLEDENLLMSMFQGCKTLDGRESTIIDRYISLPTLEESKPTYDYSLIKDVPTATLKNCTSDVEMMEIIHKFCKV